MSPTAQPGDLYFAYGSNLDLLRLTVWCIEAGLDEPALDVLGPAYLADHQLVFSRFSSSWGGGVADVQPTPGAVVPGLLLRVRDAATWQALDAKEGAPTVYRQVAAAALTADGGWQSVWTYRVCAPEAFVAPSAAYLQVVERGRQAWGMVLDDLRAAATGVLAPLRPPLFVYGTLRHGQPNAGLLGQVEHRLATAAGRLWHVRPQPPYPYPGATIEPLQPADQLVGELVQPNLDRWPELDALEGFFGFERPTGHLYRRLLWTARPQPAGQAQLCWIYAMPEAPGGPRIASGDWLVQKAQ